MNSRILILLALMSAAPTVVDAAPVENISGYTFMRIPTVSQELTHSRRYSPQKGPLLNGSLACEYWYSHAPESPKTGIYFGATQHPEQQELISIGTESALLAGNADCENNGLVKTVPGTGNTATLALASKPYFTHTGVALSYRQKLTLFTPLAFTTTVLFESMTTNLGLSTVRNTESLEGSLMNYLTGIYESDTSGKAQLKLRKGLLSEHDATKAGISAISLAVSKELISLPRFSADGTLTYTLPVATPQEAKQLFAPQVGTNGHHAIEATLDLTGHVWHSSKATFSLLGGGSLSYEFPGKESRLLTLDDGIPFGQYRLSTNRQAIANQPLIPVANLLSPEISYTPGLSYSVWGGMSIRYQAFSLRLLWHSLHRETETARIAPSALVGFPILLPNAEYDTALPASDQLNMTSPIHTRHVVTTKSLTPAIDTQVLSGRIMWRTKIWKIPFGCGGGGSIPVITPPFVPKTYTVFVNFELSF